MNELNLRNTDEHESPGRSSGDPLGSRCHFWHLLSQRARLYFGKNVLMPLVAASILAMALSPIARWLERLLPRFFSAAAIVLAISAVGRRDNLFHIF
jgi:hypothetical protein